MLGLLEWSNIGDVIATNIIDFIGSLNFSGFPLLLIIFLLVIVIFNIMMAVLYSVNTSSSSWSENNNQSVIEIDGTDIEE